MNTAYDPNDPLVRPSVAAKQLGVTTETLRRWILKGVIAYVEVGPSKRKRIRQSQIDRQLLEGPQSSA